MRVELLYAECGKAWRLSLELDAGATVGEALRRFSGQAADWPEAALAPAAVALYGRIVGPEQVLGEGDRLELLRALRCDPKAARRQRAAAANSRSRPG